MLCNFLSSAKDRPGHCRSKKRKRDHPADPAPTSTPVIAFCYDVQDLKDDANMDSVKASLATKSVYISG